MQAEEISPREFWWTVTLEAAAFFSLPTWVLTVEEAWPTDDPVGFAFALLAGASAATLVCHIAPAFWIRKFSGFGNGRWSAVAQWTAVAGLCASAGVCLGQVARAAVFLTRLWYEDRASHSVTAGAAIVALAVASAANRLGRAANAPSGYTGIVRGRNRPCRRIAIRTMARTLGANVSGNGSPDSSTRCRAP